MTEALALAANNLISPIILSFVLGLSAALVRSELIEAAFSVVERHIGLVSVSDAEVLRADRF